MPQIAISTNLESGPLDDHQPLRDLFTSLYEDLHRRARWELRRDAPLSLGATTLLHETFLNMSNRDSVTFTDTRQFMAYAARAMRGLIVDHFRNRQAQKRGGQLEFTPLDTNLPQDAVQVHDADGLSDALESLASIDPRLAECVDMKFFCGLSFSEIAKLRDVSERTVQRDWDKARLLLNHLMNVRDAAAG